MKKFVVTTTSESGDNYIYLLEHPKEPSKTDLKKFLKKHATDKDDSRVYEAVEELLEITEDKFLKI